MLVNVNFISDIFLFFVFFWIFGWFLSRFFHFLLFFLVCGSLADDVLGLLREGMGSLRGACRRILMISWPRLAGGSPKSKFNQSQAKKSIKPPISAPFQLYQVEKRLNKLFTLPWSSYSHWNKLQSVSASPNLKPFIFLPFLNLLTLS